MAASDKTRSRFTDEDAARLDEMLYPLADQGGLPFEAVDGLLSSVVVAPELIPPSEWMPLILGENPNPWSTPEEAEVFTDLVMRLYNHIVERVVPEPDASAMPFIAFPEDFDELDAEGIAAIDFPLGGNWAVGFMIGVGLCGEKWDALASADEDIRDDFSMIVALLPEDPEGDDDAKFDDSEQGSALRWSADEAEPDDDDEAPRALDMSERLEIISDLAAALHHMNRVRLASLNSKEPLRREMKIGRNDPCPCGSGEKFKKCHGASVN
jgi:uncharacterized protein